MEKNFKTITVRIDVSTVEGATSGKFVFMDAVVYYGKQKDVVGIEASKVDEVITFISNDIADAFVLEETKNVPPQLGEIITSDNVVTIHWNFGEERAGGTFRVSDIIESVE